MPLGQLRHFCPQWKRRVSPQLLLRRAPGSGTTGQGLAAAHSPRCDGRDTHRDIACRSLVLFVCLILCSGLPVQAQQTGGPTVTFTFDFPGSDPSHFMISVDSDGHASYVSRGKITSEAEPDEPYRLDFSVLPETSTRIFDLTKRARDFEGEVDLKKKGLASTGMKTLAYKDGQKSTQASYNYSAIPAIQELTGLFENLSATLEFGKRLEYDFRYQKLALNEELKHMEDASSMGTLEELAAVAPMLQKIARDQSIVNVARARAQRLLERAKTGHN